MECYSYLRYVQDLLVDGKHRFGEPFRGPEFLFGQWLIIRFLQETSHGSANVARKFTWHILRRCIAVGSWKDVLVADIELENLDASEIRARRLNAKEVLSHHRDEQIFLVPFADGTAKLSGRDQEFRKPAHWREQPVMSEDLRGELQGDPEGFQPTENKRRR